MNPPAVYAVRRLIWKNLLFFGITTALTFTALPLYACFVGLTAADWAVFFFMAAATMMATTFGYHRLFAHRAFRAHPVVTFLCLFFGAAAFEQSALRWASQHRDHHRFTDTERDPYNIRKGFWHAHMGWFLFYDHRVDYENARDLASDRMIKNQHKFWIFWALLGGIALPLAAGFWSGRFWGALFLGVIGRFFVVHQSVFLINSACHMFGKPTYDAGRTARDSWVCALLTNGEGYHNFHHAFPNDYRNGVRWYHWDPTKWMIKALEIAGLTRDLKKTPEVMVQEARLAREHHDLKTVVESGPHPKLAEALHGLSVNYEKLISHLRRWEEEFNAYKRLSPGVHAQAIRRAAGRMKSARGDFFRARRGWTEFTKGVLSLVSAAS